MIQPLEKLDFIDRATLLHQLFPSEIPALLRYVAAMGQTVVEDLKQSEWNNGNISFDTWLSLARTTYARISNNTTQLYGDSKAFAFLFDGYEAIFMAHCLRLYVDTQQQPNKKFAKMVQVLFGHTQ